MLPMQALEQPTIWLSAARSVARGRAARDYIVYDAAGAPALTAQTSAWDREIDILTAAEPAQRFLLLRRRFSFPLTGRVDVYDERRARLGIVSRSGRYMDAHGRGAGRFRDARSFGAQAREGALIGVLDALLGGDGTTTHASGPSGFVWLVGSQVMGTLGRARLPFGNDAASAAATAAAATGRLSALTRRLRELVGPARPQGWKLERLLAAPPGDPRLVLAAALFAIELAQW